MNTAIITHRSAAPEGANPVSSTLRIDRSGADPHLPDEQALAATDRLPRLREEEVHIDLDSDDCFFQGFDTDPARGGVFVATDAAIAAGTRVVVDIAIPSLAARFRVLGVVEFESPGGELAAGVGVRFLAINEEARRSVARFARRREPLFYTSD